MINKEFNKDELKKAMRKKYFSKKDILVKGKRVDFETQIKESNEKKIFFKKRYFS